MYYIYGQSGPSLLIESTDSMIILYNVIMYDEHVHVHVCETEKERRKREGGERERERGKREKERGGREKERGERERRKREREADSMKTDSITQIQVIQRSLRWSH